jgi:hypothetical protein
VGNDPSSGTLWIVEAAAADAEEDLETVELDLAEVVEMEELEKRGEVWEGETWKGFKDTEDKWETEDKPADDVEVFETILVVGEGDAVGIPVGINTLFDQTQIQESHVISPTSCSKTAGEILQNYSSDSRYYCAITIVSSSPGVRSERVKLGNVWVT